MLAEISALFISAVPGLEARAAALYMMCTGNFILIPAAVLINFIAVLIFLRLLDSALVPERVERFLKKRARKAMHKAERWFKKYGNIAIFLLVALPSTGIGSFSGAFIGRIFGLRGYAFYLAIIFGIALSLIPAMLVAYGINVLGLGC
ncbi:MAG: small multi-drug export protein [Candidatus Aenigmarchaeota archaeon]|nr:small multi-drug export protein [Candidatus Aenigmarchaeota archaeon]